MALTTAVASDSPTGQQKKGTTTRQTAIPFARSAKYHTEQGNSDTGRVINTAQPGTVNYPIPSYGFLAGVILRCDAIGGSGAVAVYYEDAPWAVIGSIALYDVNGSPIWGPFSGYSAFAASNFGGYRLFGVSGSNAAFGPAAATAIGNNPVNYTRNTGSFGFSLPLWLEFGMDSLGVLPNNDASARYNLQVQYASATATASGPVYTTAPTTYPLLSSQVEVQCRSTPPAVDLFGNANSITPPAVGTTQYWSQQSFTQLTGAQTLQLSRVGNIIRNHILIFRDTANGTRATAETTDLPGSLEMDWDSNIRYVENTVTYRMQSYLSRGYDDAFGIITLPYTTDPDTLAVRELGDEWMATVGATKITFRFTPGGNCSLLVLTNDFVAASDEVYAAGYLAMGY
jgi:hypothetical protein